MPKDLGRHRWSGRPDDVEGNGMVGRLRIFLYRDDAIVSQFLEQLEGGLFDEENIRRQAANGGSVGGGVTVGPVDVKGSRNRSTGEETEFNLRQTGPSRFSRFHELATASDDVQPLDAIDEAIWDQLETGEVIDARVMIDIPDILKSLDFASRASELIPFFEAFGSMRGEDDKPLVDPEEMRTVKRQLPVVEQAAALAEDAPLSLVASLASDPKFKFGVRLKRDNIQVDSIQDLDGEARLVASIQSKVLRGKPTQVGQLLPNVPAQNRAQRRRSGDGGGSTTNITLRYPAAVVAPIAIFR